MYDLLQSAGGGISFELLVLGVSGSVELRTQQLQQGQQKLLGVLLPVTTESGLFSSHCVLELRGSLSPIRRVLYQLHQSPVGNGHSARRSHLSLVAIGKKIVIEPGEIEHTL